MSSRNFFGTNSASTPIAEVSLPRITMSEIEATSSSRRFRKTTAKNYNSSSSSDLRDSKERFFSSGAKMKSSRRRDASRTPDELRKKARRMKRNERKKKARRQIENSDTDEKNWETTRENSLQLENVRDQTLIEEVPTESVEKIRACVAAGHVDGSDEATNYPWEKPREVVRDAPRIRDSFERLEKPLFHGTHPGAEKEIDVPSEDPPFIDLDNESELYVNEHEKCYPAATQNKACGSRTSTNKEIGMRKAENRLPRATFDQPEKRHVRNRQIMMVMRKRVEERTKRVRRRKTVQKGRGKRSSSCEMATTYGGSGKGGLKIYDLVSPIEESDDEVFVVEGLRFLKIPPRRKFFRPAKSPEVKIDSETGTCTVVRSEEERHLSTKVREENMKSLPVVPNAIGTRSAARIHRDRSIDEDKRATATTEKTSRNAEKLVMQSNNDRYGFVQSKERSNVSVNRTRRKVDRSRASARSRAVGESSSAKLSSKNGKEMATREKRCTDNDSSLSDRDTDRRQKNELPTRSATAKRCAAVHEKNPQFEKNSRGNSTQNLPILWIETDDSDSSTDDFTWKPVKRRRRIDSCRTRTGESSSRTGSEKFDRAGADGLIGKKSATKNRREKKLAQSHSFSTEAGVPSKKKYRRIRSLIYSDSSTSSEEPSKIPADQTIEAIRRSFSKNEEPSCSNGPAIEYDSGETLIIMEPECLANRTIVRESVSVENILDTILEESSSVEARRNRTKEKKIVRDSSSASTIRQETSSRVPKIISTKTYYDVLRKCNSNKWKINTPNDFDDL